MITTAKDYIVAIQTKSGKWRLREYKKTFKYTNPVFEEVGSFIKDHSGRVMTFDTLTEAIEHTEKIK